MYSVIAEKEPRFYGECIYKKAHNYDEATAIALMLFAEKDIVKCGIYHNGMCIKTFQV